MLSKPSMAILCGCRGPAAAAHGSPRVAQCRLPDNLSCLCPARLVDTGVCMLACTSANLHCFGRLRSPALLWHCRQPARCSLREKPCLKASAKSAPHCTCQHAKCGCKHQPVRLLTACLGEWVAWRRQQRVCLFVFLMVFSVGASTKQEELSAGSDCTGTLDKEVDAIRVNLKGFPDTEFFRVEVCYLTYSRNLDTALLDCVQPLSMLASNGRQSSARGACRWLCMRSAARASWG